MFAVFILMEALISVVPICMSIFISITLTAKMFTSFSHTVCCLFFMVHYFKPVNYRFLDC
jgi:hypothetical protein